MSDPEAPKKPAMPPRAPLSSAPTPQPTTATLSPPKGLQETVPALSTTGRRRKKGREPTEQLNMRMPVSLYNRFIDYHEQEGLKAYYDTIEMLLDEVGAPKAAQSN